MLYALFLALAVIYNLRKFRKERGPFVSSIIEAKNDSHRQMILSHHFYIFVFESFISVIVAHFISERAMAIGMIGLGSIYLILLLVGFIIYQVLIKHLEKQTGLPLASGFNRHIVQELRFNIGVALLPVLIYSIINLTFQDGITEEWGHFWFIGLIFNIIFVSVLTIVLSVIIMLKLIPNREITEPEYLAIINKRLQQIGMPNLRVRWIETDVKNAFVAGLKLFRFSNQTMFVGKSLRTALTLEEFDAVISHELSHVANRHIHQRVLDLLKNFLSVIVGTGIIMLTVVGISYLYWGEDSSIHTSSTATIAVAFTLGWIIFNFALLFDGIRSHEYEADAYAVMVLGTSPEAMRSALHKLTQPEELPDYLKARRPKPAKKGWLSQFLKRHFTTHPSVESRLASLQHKMYYQLPYNFYLSRTKKIRQKLGSLMKWKVLVPGTAMLAMYITWTVMHYQSGAQMMAFLQKASNEEIIARQDITSYINKRPTVIGPTLMYYVVKRGDPALIDHFVQKGAEKGRTLMYLAQLKDLKLFEKYYYDYHTGLSDEEYFLILRKSAQVNFTEGYRLLVNAKRFETLDPFYKLDIATFHKSEAADRAPASEKK